MDPDTVTEPAPDPTPDRIRLLSSLILTVWRIRDVYPGSRILIFTHPGSRIQELGSRIPKQQQNRVEKKIFVIPFYLATNFTKLNIILVLKS
jgi:hypothetical protein